MLKMRWKIIGFIITHLFYCHTLSDTSTNATITDNLITTITAAVTTAVTTALSDIDVNETTSTQEKPQPEMVETESIGAGFIELMRCNKTFNGTGVFKDTILELYNQTLIDLPKRQVCELEINIDNATLKHPSVWFDGIIPRLVADQGNVTLLNLSHNSIESVLKTSISLNFSEDLRRLDLSYNQIEVVNILAFRNLSKLETLYLNNNKIRTIIPPDDPNIWPPENLTHTDYVAMKYINLSRNSLEVIKSTTFSCFKGLQILDLSFNEIMKIETKSFLTNKNLAELFLQENKLPRLSLTFNCNSLKVVNITGNKIERLNFNYDTECVRRCNMTIYGKLEESEDTHVISDDLNSIALNNMGLGKILRRIDKKFCILDGKMTKLNNLTADMFITTSEMMKTVVWLRIANFCSAIIAASCIVPVLVIMCRAHV